tara:strand:+ start:119 stop:292 length:174 start_codon:yes stop_codon:yes gene_type:complete
VSGICCPAYQLATIYINFIQWEKIMNRRKIESELLAYKYLCLFVLGFALGYFVGGAI